MTVEPAVLCVCCVITRSENNFQAYLVEMRSIRIPDVPSGQAGSVGGGVGGGVGVGCGGGVCGGGTDGSISGSSTSRAVRLQNK
jgi:hypothetical protein